MQYRMQRIDRRDVTRPESISASSDIPISQNIQKRSDLGACSKQIVFVETFRRIRNQISQFGKNVAI